MRNSFYNNNFNYNKSFFNPLLFRISGRRIHFYKHIYSALLLSPLFSLQWFEEQVHRRKRTRHYWGRDSPRCRTKDIDTRARSCSVNVNGPFEGQQTFCRTQAPGLGSSDGDRLHLLQVRPRKPTTIGRFWRFEVGSASFWCFELKFNADFRIYFVENYQNISYERSYLPARALSSSATPFTWSET